jgi:6-pyruvoyltetrahydropterin/6-carboxytetrahydropterin synthase
VYTISKDFAWSSSHVLEGLPDGHQCGRLHGHNYVARVILTSDTLDATGFVVDYGELGFVKDFIDNTWDHRHLNDAVPFTTMNATAENMARTLAYYVHDRISDEYPNVRVAVSISETPKTWSTYTMPAAVTT